MADDGVTSESDGHMSEIDDVDVSDDEELLDEAARAGLSEQAREAFERLERRSAAHKIHWQTQRARTQAWIDKYEVKRQKLSRSTRRVRDRNAEILVLKNFIETLRNGLRELREEVNGACDRDTLLEIIQRLLSLQIPGVRFRNRARNGGQTLDVRGRTYCVFEVWKLKCDIELAVRLDTLLRATSRLLTLVRNLFVVLQREQHRRPPSIRTSLSHFERASRR
jgi:hypothetical protein